MKAFIFFLCLILIFGFAFVYLQKNPSFGIHIPQVALPSPTPVVTPVAVLGERTDSLCHAIHINPSDEQAFLPDPTCTPGVIDPLVTQENIYETICKAGYTKTVRPAVSYTNKVKRTQIQAYGYLDTNLKHFEEDHLISLELGGSPDDPKNLWPEPHASWNEKDSVENFLHRQVCSGAMTLTQVQDAISKNWYEVYINYHLGE